VVTPGKNQNRYPAGAPNPKTGKLTWVEGDRKDSDLFILQLWQLVGHDYPNAKWIYIILDNYSLHSSRRTQIALAALGNKVRLHFLPPYCPDHNRIERVWRDLHDDVTRNYRCRTMDELLEEVRAHLQARQRAIQHECATQCAA
jgi:transposase